MAAAADDLFIGWASDDDTPPAGAARAHAPHTNLRLFNASAYRMGCMYRSTYAILDEAADAVLRNGSGAVTPHDIPPVVNMWDAMRTNKSAHRKSMWWASPRDLIDSERGSVSARHDVTMMALCGMAYLYQVVRAGLLWDTPGYIARKTQTEVFEDRQPSTSPVRKFAAFMGAVFHNILRFPNTEGMDNRPDAELQCVVILVSGLFGDPDFYKRTHGEYGTYWDDESTAAFLDRDSTNPRYGVQYYYTALARLIGDVFCPRQDAPRVDRDVWSAQIYGGAFYRTNRADANSTQWGFRWYTNSAEIVHAPEHNKNMLPELWVRYTRAQLEFNRRMETLHARGTGVNDHCRCFVCRPIMAEDLENMFVVYGMALAGHIPPRGRGIDAGLPRTVLSMQIIEVPTMTHPAMNMRAYKDDIARDITTGLRAAHIDPNMINIPELLATTAPAPTIYVHASPGYGGSMTSLYRGAFLAQGYAIPTHANSASCHFGGLPSTYDVLDSAVGFFHDGAGSGAAVQFNRGIFHTLRHPIRIFFDTLKVAHGGKSRALMGRTTFVSAFLVHHQNHYMALFHTPSTTRRMNPFFCGDPWSIAEWARIDAAMYTMRVNMMEQNKKLFVDRFMQIWTGAMPPRAKIPRVGGLGV